MLEFILRCTVLPRFTISNLLLLKRSFQYNTKFGKNWCFNDLFIRLLLKTFWKNYVFKYNFLNFISGSTVLQTFTILNFLLQKWRPFQYNVKFETKTSFIIVLIRLFSKSLWTKSCNVFQGLVFCLVLRSQTCWY